MKLLLLFSAILFATQIQAQKHHLVAYDGINKVNVQLESAVHHGQWNCSFPVSSCEIDFQHQRRKKTNATFKCAGLYDCFFLSQQKKVTNVTVQIVNTPDLPLVMLSELFIKELLHVQYRYLTLSNRFLLHYQYLPNISKFFKGLMTTAAETMSTTAKYILAKYVTTKELDGSTPPNYIEELFQSGFVSELTNLTFPSTLNLTHGFQQAFDIEKRLVSVLTDIAKFAEKFNDGELEEFVVADLMPPMLVRLKMLSNHKNTVEGLTEGDRALGEYIFDRHFS